MVKFSHHGGFKQDEIDQSLTPHSLKGKGNPANSMNNIQCFVMKVAIFTNYYFYLFNDTGTESPTRIFSLLIKYEIMPNEKER